MPDGDLILHKGGIYRFWVHADDEIDCLNAWLYGVLSGDAALAAIVGTRVVEGIAPETTLTPFVSFYYLNAQPDAIAGGDHTAVLDYMVKLTDQYPNYTQITPGVVRLKTLLDVADITTANGTIVAGQRLKPYSQEDPEV